MYNQMSVTMRPYPQYHSMYFGAPAATPASIVPKSSVRLSAARTIAIKLTTMPMVRNSSLYSHDQLKIETSAHEQIQQDQSTDPGGDRERHALGRPDDAGHVEEQRGEEDAHGREHRGADDAFGLRVECG